MVGLTEGEAVALREKDEAGVPVDEAVAVNRAVVKAEEEGE